MVYVLDMAVVFSRKEVGFTETSVTANVPDNDTARLMYYLKSMCTVLGLETTEYNIARLTDYKKYYMLTIDERVTLFALCEYLSPDALNNKCIFHSDEMCGNSPNRFFRLNSTETAFVAAESVFVGTTKVSVKKIMVYKMSWMRRNYIEPMTRRAITSNNTTKNNANWIYSSNSSSVDCCVIS